MNDVRVVAALLVLVLGIAGGYLMWSTKYTPAIEARDTAVKTQQDAEKTLQDKRAELARIKSQPKEVNKEPLANYLVSKVAIPQRDSILEARIELEELAAKTLVPVKITAGAGDSAAGTSSGTPVPGASGGNTSTISLTIEGTASYDNLMSFMQKLHETVQTKAGKAYVRGRLYNITSLELGANTSSSSDSSSGSDSISLSGGGTGGTGEYTGLIDFTLTVEMYADPSGNSTTGEPTPTTSNVTPSGGSTTPGAAPAPGGNGTTTTTADGGSASQSTSGAATNAATNTAGAMNSAANGANTSTGPTSTSATTTAGGAGA